MSQRLVLLKLTDLFIFFFGNTLLIAFTYNALYILINNLDASYYL